MKLNGKARGWLALAAIILAMGVVGHMEESEAREVVCMPSVQDPKPTEEGEKIPVVYRF